MNLYANKTMENLEQLRKAATVGLLKSDWEVIPTESGARLENGKGTCIFIDSRNFTTYQKHFRVA